MSPTQVEEYERGLSAAMAQTDKHPLSSYAVEAYGQCAEEVRKIGATPIFLITPSTTQINVASESNGLTSVVMAFNNPRTYPSLYRSSVRRDGQHLTKSGAEEFTRIVAANFVELARAGNVK
jgi:acetylglutamate synthase